MLNTIQELNTISKLEKFHANKHHKVFTFSEIKEELKVLMQEFRVYNTNKMRIV
jgi:hypothetical protein